jgi:hypothetical protein
MDAALATATERMGVKDYKGAQKAIDAAHALLAPAGLALAWVATAVIGAPAPDGSSPPVYDPMGAGFKSQAEFNAWIKTSSQSVYLDSVQIQNGFGPPLSFYTQTSGAITITPRIVIVTPPEIEVPVETPVDPEPEYVPPAVYKKEELAPYIVGVSGVGANSPEVTMAPGVIYAIPIVLPALEGMYEWSMCEFRGEPAPHTARLSLNSGDLERPYTDYNLTPNLRIEVSKSGPYKPGMTIYVNTCISEPFPRKTPVHYDVLFRTS